VSDEGEVQGTEESMDPVTHGEPGQAAETPATGPLESSDPLPLESSPVPATPSSPELAFNLTEAIETLLFASEGPLPVTRIAELTGQTEEAIGAAVADLNLQYEQGGRTFRIHKLALGFQFYTLPEHVSWVRQLYRRQFTHRLSAPALEVLAIVAYKQPVTRPEIESLRGVDCSGPLVTLLERRLVTTAGRAHKPGSPFLYRTTREFLRYFGLESLDHLPPLDELGEFLANAQAAGEREVHDTLAIGSPTGLGEVGTNEAHYQDTTPDTGHPTGEITADEAGPAEEHESTKPEGVDGLEEPPADGGAALDEAEPTDPGSTTPDADSAPSEHLP
jgi:segregation and condensation protein B